MSVAEILTTQVDLSGLLTVLGENLYSTPAVVLRELVQNSHDSCTRRAIETAQPVSGRIVVKGEPSTGKLILEDNGSGLTRQEIIDYLATIGSGYTRKLRNTVQDDSLIGYFGLGFLSAYVVSDRITVWTTSYQEPHTGWRFTSKGGDRYTIEPAEARPIGTQVTLQLKERFQYLADPEALAALLSKYCLLLPLPVFLGSDAEVPINAQPPPWRRSDLPSSELARKRDKLSFAQAFESHFAPLATVDIQSPPDQHAHGLLWIQDGATYGSSDNRHLAVFVRGMLITEDAKDLLPRWAGFVGGVMESNALTPTASREDLMRDLAYESISRLLNESLIDGLAKLAREDRATWRRILTRHNEALLGAALCDDRLFDLLAPELTIPTSEGELTVNALLARSPGRFLVSLNLQGGIEEVLFRALKVPVASGGRYAVLPFLSQYASKHGVSVVQLGTKEGNQRFFPDVQRNDGAVDWLQQTLARSKQRVVLTRFEPAALPLVVVPDRDSELKERIEQDNADRWLSQAALGLARLYTKNIDGSINSHLYVNCASPVVERLLAIHQSHPERTTQAIQMLKVLAGLLESSTSDSNQGDFQETLRMYSDLIAHTLQ